jgi:ABC-type phosphate transport system substrate-binding protein
MTKLRVVLASMALLLGAGRLSAQSYILVVNNANPVSTLSKGAVSDLFLKRAVRFADGQPASPVNLDRSAAARDAFSRAVHGKSAAAVESFWQEQIFAGKETPPPTRGSDAEVLAFVRAKPGAIGYVSTSAVLGTDVKVVRIN